MLEMMVVVVMVGILATLAIPSIIHQLQSNRTYRAAEEIAISYRQARVRAMGRGSAVLFRFSKTGGGAGEVEVREALTPLAGAAEEIETCQTPRASCQGTGWLDSTNDNRKVSSFRVGEGVFSNIELSLLQGSGEGATAITGGEFCFTPLGRLYFRANSTQSFTPLPAQAIPIMSILVERTDNVSFPRRVLLPNNGAASVVAEAP